MLDGAGLTPVPRTGVLANIYQECHTVLRHLVCDSGFSRIRGLDEWNHATILQGTVQVIKCMEEDVVVISFVHQAVTGKTLVWR